MAGELLVADRSELPHPPEEMTARSWKQIIDVNLTGAFHCAQAAIGDMIEARWGRVVFPGKGGDGPRCPGRPHGHR